MSLSVNIKKVLLSIGAITVMTAASSTLPVPAIIAQCANALGAISLKERKKFNSSLKK